MANKKLSALITIGGAVSGTLTSALGTTKGKILEVGGAIRQVKDRQAELNRVLKDQERLGVGASALKMDLARQELAILDQKVAKLKQVESQLRRVDSAQQANLSKRSDLRSKMVDTAAVGAAVLLPAASAFKKASDFGYQLQLIANTADMSKEKTLELGVAILDASRKTGQSSQEMQKAIGFLVAAGMNVDTAKASVVQIGRTATASGADIEDLAKAAFTLNDALKIAPGKALQNAMDTLAQAGKEGNVELKDMAKVLPVLGSGMVSLKMEGREAAATLGAALQIARKGAADADEAANNMKNFIAKVMSPETLKKAKKNFNLDLYKIIQDAQSKGKNPFEASMAAIIKATQGDQKKIGDLFQDMQVQNFLRPMIQNWADYKKIKEKSLAASGVTDRDFDKIAATSKQQLNEMSNASGRLAIVVGQSLEPAVAGLASTLTPVIESVSRFVDGNRELVGNSILVVGGLTTLRLGVLATGFAMTFLRGGALSLVGLFYRIGPAAAAAGAGSTAAAGGVTLLGRALLFAGKGVLWIGRALLLNPIGLAVTAIAGAAYLIYKNWEPIKGFFGDLWDGITARFTAGVAWIEQKIGAIGAAWQSFKSAFGLGSAVGPGVPQGAASPASAAGRIDIPPLAASRASAGQVITDNSKTEIAIHQQPGQSAQQLADEVLRKLNERRTVRQRGALYDMAGG